VAVKVLPEGVSSDSERLKRFEKEARSASSLNHQNIVTIHDIGSEGDVSYIAMELVEGTTLRAALAPGPLPVKKSLQVAQQIAEGLARAHEAGIVHRDLKPENVMLKKDGLVKILDFGLAKLSGTSAGSDSGSQLPTMTGTQPGVVVGTVSYMSPEQASGEQVDFRSDQFSFGSILYEICTGKRAFSRRTAVDTLAAILNEEPPAISELNPQTPAPLRWIVERCLSKEAKERYSATDDLARDIGLLREHISEGLSLSGQLAPGTSATRRGRSRGRLGLLLGGVAAATALLCAAVAWVALQRLSERPPPAFRQLTFRRGQILSARFGPDGRTVLYSAAWNGKPVEVFAGLPDSPDYRPFGLEGAEVLSVARTGGSMAVLQNRVAVDAYRQTGTLAQVSVVSAAAPRDILKQIEWADWAPEGKSLAIVRMGPSKMRLEYPPGKVLYETSGWVSHPRVSSDGGLLAFIDHPTLNDDGGSIAIVDRSARVRRLSEPFASAFGLAWSPDGEVWFTASRVGLNRSLFSATLGGRVRERIRVPGLLTLQDISSDGRVLVTQDSVRTEVVALPPGESIERDLTWLDYPAPASISADGKKILFSETGEGGGAGYSVYIRSTDGTPAIRLGEGLAQDLSPDGEWALAILQTDEPQLVAYPTGAGEAKLFPKEGLWVDWAKWMPDGKQVLLTAKEKGKAQRIYLWDPGGGKPRAVVPENYSGGISMSPDGKWTVVAGPDRLYLYPLTGGEPIPIRGLEPGDAVDEWSRDGRYLFVHRGGEVPVKVFRLELSTGHKQLWRTLMPADAAGVRGISLKPAKGVDSYIYFYPRTLSALYLIQGVR
jgi:Tol biopolymer transport system component